MRVLLAELLDRDSDMGYGSQIRITFETKDLVWGRLKKGISTPGYSYVFNKPYEIWDSWSLESDAVGLFEKQGMSIWKINLLPAVVHPEDVDYMKRNGIDLYKEYSFKFAKPFTGTIFSGYVRSPLEVCFPAEMKADLDGNTFDVKLSGSIKPVSLDKFREVLNSTIDR